MMSVIETIKGGSVGKDHPPDDPKVARSDRSGSLHELEILESQELRTGESSRAGPRCQTNRNRNGARARFSATMTMANSSAGST